MAKDWVTVRDQITELYRTKTLSEVRDIMESRGFTASVRSYRSTIKEWGILKQKYRQKTSLSLSSPNRTCVSSPIMPSLSISPTGVSSVESRKSPGKRDRMPSAGISKAKSKSKGHQRRSSKVPATRDDELIETLVVSQARPQTEPLVTPVPEEKKAPKNIMEENEEEEEERDFPMNTEHNVEQAVRDGPPVQHQTFTVEQDTLTRQTVDVNMVLGTNTLPILLPAYAPSPKLPHTTNAINTSLASVADQQTDPFEQIMDAAQEKNNDFLPHFYDPNFPCIQINAQSPSPPPHQQHEHHPLPPTHDLPVGHEYILPDIVTLPRPALGVLFPATAYNDYTGRLPPLVPDSVFEPSAAPGLLPLSYNPELAESLVTYPRPQYYPRSTAGQPQSEAETYEFRGRARTAHPQSFVEAVPPCEPSLTSVAAASHQNVMTTEFQAVNTTHHHVLECEQGNDASSSSASPVPQKPSQPTSRHAPQPSQTIQNPRRVTAAPTSKSGDPALLQQQNLIASPTPPPTMSAALDPCAAFTTVGIHTMMSHHPGASPAPTHYGLTHAIPDILTPPVSMPLPPLPSPAPERMGSVAVDDGGTDPKFTMLPDSLDTTLDTIKYLATLTSLSLPPWAAAATTALPNTMATAASGSWEGTSVPQQTVRESFHYHEGLLSPPFSPEIVTSDVDGGMNAGNYGGDGEYVDVMDED